ncbi:hypothetical protein M0R45_006687 [Rubus argutus]|uniref:Uncharacterized protein n=1 Tax=Rubus argutus TaxID=59490 RepID=A0AAW1YRA3_RUBAR
MSAGNMAWDDMGRGDGDGGSGVGMVWILMARWLDRDGIPAQAARFGSDGEGKPVISNTSRSITGRKKS